MTLLGFRLKGEDYLQLRVEVSWRDGICHRIVDEHPDLIYVRVLGCHPEDEADDPRDPSRERFAAMDSPCNVTLAAPLGERVVIDVDTGEPLPMLIPRWGTGEASLYVPRPPGLLWLPEATGGEL